MFTYQTFSQALAIEMAVPNNNPLDPQFVAILPTLIDQSEQRCYRDLDLLYATETGTAALTVGSSKLDFSALNLLILEDMNIIVPATVINPELGERIQVVPVSKEWLRAVWGLSTTRGIPVYYAMNDDHSVLLGPFPDAAYTAELIGKFRPPPLSATNTSTILTTLVPDLFLAAAMVASTGYQHNWGAQTDDPRSALSWKSEYDTLLASAQAEEMRKKMHAWMGMTAERPPPPVAPGTPGPI